MFKNIGLIGKHDDPRIEHTLGKLISFINTQPVNVFIDAESVPTYLGERVIITDRESLGKTCDLVIVIGGDGTFLNAARSLADCNARVLGINLGRLGFLADVMPTKMIDRLKAVLRGDFEEEKRFLLDTVIVRHNKPVFEVIALNDVVAHKWHIARLIAFEAYIDSHLVYSQRADGLIVSTPTGSTAYALSSGGPILHPNLNAIALVPICPHTLSNRPIVVDGESLVEIVMEKDGQAEASVTCDGQTSIDLEPEDRILIQKRDKCLHLIHPVGYNYYTTLRTKLNWDWNSELGLDSKAFG
uniref:NAD kinase n=1 Tax=Candidatus Kentrum sp. TUN TaxID=2126343 RepID=A0A450ZNL5_9GAMM|nr:MAG: NAD+ kinase [Candidatus Kentron sp. TUN]VFK55311.1 MAG: NAD+ kinase [Candidatus Kentron sp. TUN]VFK60563.1 MAG: NAD+ kinase [Candidatus Kentron sp. TUN]